jgi:hypothetical protein
MKIKKTYKAGFDLTEIGAMNFFKLLKLNKLTYTNRKLDRVNSGYNPFVWGFKDGHIVTNNDPLTGTYANARHRAHEIGYASYIGIEGTKSFRDRVVKFIKRNAVYIKDYSKNKRDYI